MERTDVTFESGGADCAGWLYLPGSGPAPVIVMAHGTGGVRAMRLDAFAERFAAAGFACLVFDYRGFGDSGGHPRQVMDIKEQLLDWRSAIGYARTHPDVDGTRLVLWGTSFSGGHVLRLAAEDETVLAVVAQCPFTDGIASARTVPPARASRVLWYSLIDRVRARRGRPPLLISAAGPPGSVALMTAPDSLAGYLALVPLNVEFVNQVAARIALSMLRYRPGREVAKIACPVMFSVCQYDTEAPALPTLSSALTARHAEIRIYPVGHFDVYRGPTFEQVVGDQLTFLLTHVNPHTDTDPDVPPRRPDHAGRLLT